MELEINVESAVGKLDVYGVSRIRYIYLSLFDISSSYKRDHVSQERCGVENECNVKNENVLFECLSVGK